MKLIQITGCTFRVKVKINWLNGISQRKKKKDHNSIYGPKMEVKFDVVIAESPSNHSVFIL